ncbi:hypothetical protein A2311_01090 [candidate division WOR-1 bacterium RIFOXYB2_FULL_48_7]|uniref:DUF1622 domain-containing protein n=1 Tax=candidate division WOR-1 bacterium RIFOXYB2_FULL_48_7 TaxID=1802583 RepID=A0A1F4TNS7_UNCSA|nr:MAG: hypothetical protein A2311_01090 [candidate division WOR-1 bacterium RIFOXYB2_FULL_48_7]
MSLQQFVEYVVYIVSFLGMAIVLWGILVVTIKFLLGLFNDDAAAKLGLRQRLGAYLVLGLEYFIAADIVRTIIRPDWNEIGMLAAIIALRTILSYFLGLELRSKL